jgi:CHAD domain-containing protein
MKLLPEVLNGESAKAVHDLRVWSRRLQQVLAATFLSAQEDRASQLFRTIRQARRSLSGWRDCDVVMELLDRRLRRLRDPDERQAWQVVRDYLAKRREREIRRARRRLARRRLFTLPQRTTNLIACRGSSTAPNLEAGDVDTIALVAGFVKAAYSDWLASLEIAVESDNPIDAHHFRIKTKKLRYRMELARDLGDEKVLLPLNWLKPLQERLGQSHDRVELARIASEAITEAGLLLTAPRSASLLLKRLARELLSEVAKVKSLLAAIKDASELLQLEIWVTSQNEELHPKGSNTESYDSSSDDVSSGSGIS